MFDNIKVFILMCLNKLGLYTKTQYEEVDGAFQYCQKLLEDESYTANYFVAEADSVRAKSLWARACVISYTNHIHFLAEQLEGQSELTDKLNLLVEALYSDLEDERKKVEILTEQLIEKRKRK